MYIVFDIGGTKMRVAASRDCKEFIGEPKVVSTPKNFDDGVALFKHIAGELCAGEEIQMAAGGIAGHLDKKKEFLRNSPHTDGWVGKPLKEKLMKAVGAPVHIRNDAAIVGLGEAHFGAGRDHNIVVYITVSTGVGGSRIVDGYIDENIYGFEPGHQIIDADHTLCEKCESGRFEDLVSGTATAIRFGEKAYEVKNEHLWTVELPHWIAFGLTNTILHWSPNIVVLGGSMVVGDPAISIPHIRNCVKDSITIFPELPEIKMAELGDFGGLYGGLAYIKQKEATFSD